MITTNADPQRRLVRDADRAMLGGVCAGLAAYLGFNLKVTRILAFIAFLTAMPIAVVAYLAAVFLIPSAFAKKVHKKRGASNRELQRPSKDAVNIIPELH